MATSTITTCDWIAAGTTQAHGVPATTRFEAFLEGKMYEADLCDACVGEAQMALARCGIGPATARVDGKPRGAYVTDSGRTFTTAEAREWLIAEGYPVTANGRISKDLLDAYARAH